MLDKSAVDQMVRDAQEHAEEDKQRREEVETRNQAEALTFQAERAIKDLGDKVSSEDKLEVENKIESLREALKGSDMEAVKAGMTLARRVAPAGLDGGLPGGGVSRPGSPATGPRTGPATVPMAPVPDGAEGAEGAAEEETVEGEFKEV